VKWHVIPSTGVAVQLNKRVQAALQPEYQTTTTQIDEIANLWKAETCPKAFLPWLAWSQGIKEWDENWAESTQRAIVSASYEQHKHLGTRYAVVKALEPFAMDAKITEWFELEPKLPTGTFKVDVYVANRGIDLPLIKEVRTLVDRAKRKSVHYSLTVNLQCAIAIPASLISCSSNVITVFPLSH